MLFKWFEFYYRALNCCVPSRKYIITKDLPGDALVITFLWTVFFRQSAVNCNAISVTNHSQQPTL